MEKMKRFVGPDGGSISTRPNRQAEPKVHAAVAETMRQPKSRVTAFSQSGVSDVDFKNAQQVAGEIVALKILATKNGLRGLL